MSAALPYSFLGWNDLYVILQNAKCSTLGDQPWSQDFIFIWGVEVGSSGRWQQAPAVESAVHLAALTQQQKEAEIERKPCMYVYIKSRIEIHPQYVQGMLKQM